jgi:hypothetical protein
LGGLEARKGLNDKKENKKARRAVAESRNLFIVAKFPRKSNALIT